MLSRSALGRPMIASIKDTSSKNITESKYYEILAAPYNIMKESRWVIKELPHSVMLNAFESMSSYHIHIFIYPYKCQSEGRNILHVNSQLVVSCNNEGASKIAGNFPSDIKKS